MQNVTYILCTGLWTYYRHALHISPHFSLSICSHHDMDDFLQLLHSRYLPQEIVGVPDCTSKADKNSSTCVSDSEILQIVCQFNFPLLLEDIVATYFTGKPLLESPSSIRKLFKFRNTVAQHSSLHMAK